jgi:RHS repeat-associated protein
MPSGAVFRFLQNEDGSFTALAPRKDGLVKNGDDTWDLTIAGSRTRYHFLANGNVSYIQDEFGNRLEYTYDGNGRLTRIADGAGSGRYVDIYYGGSGHISGVQDSTGRQVTYTYNANGSLASVTNPLNQTATYEYVQGRFGTPLMRKVTDHWGRVITEITYDAKDRVTSYTENGETYTLSYDYQNLANQTGKTDSNGNVYISKFGKDMQVTNRTYPGAATTASVFNTDSSLQQSTDEMGVKTIYTYTGDGSVSTVTRNYQSSPSVQWEYTYDGTFPGKVTSVTAKNPGTGQVDPDWQSWQYDYYPAGSNAPGSLHHVLLVKSDATTQTMTTYEYDAAGRMTKMTNATGGVTDYAYTGANLTSVTAPSNNDGGTRPVTGYGYDALGRVTSVTDPNGKVTSYTYDASGRVLTVTLPPPSGGSSLVFTTTYSYDNYDAQTGFLFTHVTDPNGKVTKLGYDQFGRLRRSIDAANSSTVYTYTKDVLTSITDANGNVTSYQYDVRKRLSRTTFPDGAYESYTYRNDGLLNGKTDRKNQRVTYGYDAMKRMTSKTYSGGGSQTYTYTGQNLTQVVDTTLTPNETHTYGYDTSYRVTSSTQASRGTVSYTYDAAGAPATLAITGGPTATYTRYADGSLNTIGWTPVTGSFKYTYLPTGQYQSLTLPNSQVRSYGYDDQGRLLQIANTIGGTNLATYSYGYDYDYGTSQYTKLGQRTSLTATVPVQGFNQAQTRYLYDGLYQLNQVQYPNVAPYNAEVDSWTYDGIGNRLTNTVNGNTQTYTYFKNGQNPLNGQRLSSDGTNSYTYDANGNTATRTGYTVGYDAENRQSSISGGISASYTYDYQGRRTSKTVAGTTTTYLYDGLNPIAETTSGLSSYFLNGPGIDEPIAMSISGAISYFSVDSLGSVTATNDPTGTITHNAVLDAWGNTRTETGTRQHPFTYTGREVGEAGLLFYRARFYQPGIGRFASVDPLEKLLGLNFYTALDNDPIALVDPLGLDAITDDPVIKRCLCDLFKDAQWGNAPNKAERATWIVQGPDGVRRCIRWPWKNKYSSESWDGPPPDGIVAIAHTHPEKDRSPKPSPGDQNTSDAFRIPNYVCSRAGIYKAHPNCETKDRRPCPPTLEAPASWFQGCEN